MLLTRVHRHLLTWLTLWAVGFGALAPTLAHAVPRAGDTVAWVQVCSSTGMFWVRADGGPGDPATPDRAACPWCELHGGAAAPPPPGLAGSAQVLVAGAPRVHSAAASSTPAWLSPPSRAPPLVA
jgi:hypothetical protein